MKYFLMIFVTCSLCPLLEAMNRQKSLSVHAPAVTREPLACEELPPSRARLYSLPTCTKKTDEETLAIFRTLSASIMERIEKKAQSYKNEDPRIIHLLLQIDSLKNYCKKLQKAAESDDLDVTTKEFEQIESACDHLRKKLTDRLKLQNPYLE